MASKTAPDKNVFAKAGQTILLVKEQMEQLQQKLQGQQANPAKESKKETEKMRRTNTHEGTPGAERKGWVKLTHTKSLSSMAQNEVRLSN